MAAVDRPGAGKIAAVGAYLASYGPQVEADFRSEYSIDLRDLYKPGGGTSHLTYRLAASLIEQLPPQSRTKTAIRNDCDPWEMAEHAAAAGPTVGWGPHTYTDELICQLGESVDRVVYAIVKVNGGEAAEPLPWRRPGVLGADERLVLVIEESQPVRDQLEQERAEREVRRRAHKAAKAAALAAAGGSTSPQG